MFQKDVRSGYGVEGRDKRKVESEFDADVYELWPCSFWEDLVGEEVFSNAKGSSVSIMLVVKHIGGLRFGNQDKETREWVSWD